MKYETHLDRDISIGDLVVQGEMRVKYDTLVKFFGQPLEGNGITSITAEWHIVFQHKNVETIAHIYDAIPTKSAEEQEIWDISGHSRDAYRHILTLLNDYVVDNEEEEDYDYYRSEYPDNPED